jgi:hypothetical protein
MLYIGVSLLMVGIVLPAFVVGTASPRAEAISPSATYPKASPEELPATSLMPAAPGMTGSEEKDAGMSPAMKQQCDMMMNAELSKVDATCLLVLEQELNLLPEQILQLKEIREQSRKEASALLTPKQHASLTERPGRPMSIAAIREKAREVTVQKAPVRLESMGGRKE